MPDFEYSCPKLITSTPWVKAREFINRLIVNPIPQRKDTPRTSYIEILSGNLQILNFIDKYVRKLIPIGFPSRSPSIIPSGTLFVRELKLIALKSISALKKANNGNIINPEKVCSFFSKNFKILNKYLTIYTQNIEGYTISKYNNKGANWWKRRLEFHKFVENLFFKKKKTYYKLLDYYLTYIINLIYKKLRKF